MRGIAVHVLAALAVSVVAASAFSPTSAVAQSKNCYEQIGCPHKRYFQKRELRQISCQLLRDVRNMVTWSTNRTVIASRPRPPRKTTGARVAGTTTRPMCPSMGSNGITSR